MIRRWLVLLILAALTAASLPAGAQEKPMTLKECIDLALEGSLLLQTASESVTGAELKVKESNSQLWPQVSLGGTYTRMSLVQELEMSFMGQTFNMKFGLANNYDFRATLAEPLFAWGRIRKSIELSRTGVDMAKDGLALTRQAVSYQVAPLFYGILFFKESIQVLEDNIKSFDKKAAIMTERYKAGLASSFDASTLQVQVSALQAQKLDFENSIRKLTLAYNALAGRPAEAPLNPAGALEHNVQPLDRAQLIQASLAQRIEFEQLNNQTRMTELGIELAKTANKPSLALALTYDYRNGYLPDIEKLTGNFMATLSLNIPLFDGFRASAQVAEGESSLKAIQLQRQTLEQNVRMDIDTILADLKTVEQKLDIEKVKIKLAEDALRIAEDRYQKGLLSAQDFIDTQNSLETAKLNTLQLVYSHILGTFNLYRSVGKKIYD
ncbi:MAG: TolC family protein [Candidatus Aminicenantales bacterium]